MAELSHALVRELSRLGPHGHGNEAPIFRADGLRLAAPPRLVGRDRAHLQLHLGQGACVRKAIGFRLADRLPAVADAAGPLEAAFRPIISRLRNTEQVELELIDLRPMEALRERAARSAAAAGSQPHPPAGPPPHPHAATHTSRG